MMASDSNQPENQTGQEPTGQGNVFDNITDEDHPRREAVTWAASGLLLGAEFEPLIADLVIQGWSYDDAQDIVEEARKRTRADRGVVTREDVALQAEARYRSSVQASGVLGRILGFGFITGLWRALRQSATFVMKGKRDPK